jgi:Helix-hairpin-helix domain
MDSLALLCNLYGDGPATLRRLRESGLASLEAIAEAEPERLAGVLRTSVRSARRFQHEGRILIDRTASGDPAVAREAPAPEEPQSGDPLLKKVLETWRRLDDEAATPPSASQAPAPPLPSAEDVGSMNLDDAAIDGLDAAQRERLAQAGIRTLEDLTDCDAMRISSAEDIALTRVLHWQLLGRRALAGARRAASAASSDVDLTEHGILRPARPLPGARSRPAAAQIAPPQPVVDLATALPAEISEAMRADSGTAARFSPAEVPPFDEPARPELDLRERAAPRETGPSGGAALDSAGPFA